MPLPEGVYLYENGVPKRAERLELPDGPTLIFFDNVNCPYCRIFDVLWDAMVEDRELRSLNFARVVCTYFESNCGDPGSKKAFGEFKVKRSPFVVLALKNPEGTKLVELPPSKFNYDYVAMKKAILKALEEHEQQRVEER